MHSFDILWQGRLVGRLVDADPETVIAGVQLKFEGQFEPAQGSEAQEFLGRLATLEPLQVTIGNDSRPVALYWQGSGRAKLVWSPTEPYR